MAKATSKSKKIGNGLDNISKIESFLNRICEFRRNIILDRTEVSIKNLNQFELLTERGINSLFRALNIEGYKCTMQTLKSLLNSDFIPDVNPFEEYFSNLPEWSKNQSDYILELANTIECNNQEYFQIAFKKWIVGVVACSLNSELVNQQVLVLVGKQGSGKSSWLNKLLPKKLKGYLYSGLVHPSNKDTLVNLSENLLINLDELENLNKTELGSLKALISQSSIKLRKAYGIFNENYVRRASFMGSVNDAEFLTDTTGNRRYLCFTCSNIDFKHQIEMDNVYSQAYTLYKSGYPFYFTQDEIQKIEEINEQYLKVSAEEELLLKYFEPAIPTDADIILKTTSEIAIHIKEASKIDLSNNYSIRKLGQALNKHGFIKTSINGTKPYRLKLRQASQDVGDKIGPKIKPSTENEGLIKDKKEKTTGLFSEFKDINDIVFAEENTEKGMEGVPSPVIENGRLLNFSEIIEKMIQEKLPFTELTVEEMNEISKKDPDFFVDREDIAIREQINYIIKTDPNFFTDNQD